MVFRPRAFSEVIRVRLSLEVGVPMMGTAMFRKRVPNQDIIRT